MLVSLALKHADDKLALKSFDKSDVQQKLSRGLCHSK